MELCYKAVKGTANTAALTLAWLISSETSTSRPISSSGLTASFLARTVRRISKSCDTPSSTVRRSGKKLILSQRRLDLEDAACLNEIRK